MTTTTDTLQVSSGKAQLGLIVQQLDELVAYLRQADRNSLPPLVYKLAQISTRLGQVSQNVSAMEDELRNLRALASISQVVNSSLDLDVVLQIVMDTIIRLTGAERGFLMLRNEKKELMIRVARNWEQVTIEQSDFAVSRTIINQVASSGRPVLTTNAQQDQRFSGQQSIVAYNLRSILCVPMIIKTDLIGVIYADNRIRAGIFTQSEMDLLVAFANQAAVAIENARLFASVRKTLAEVTALKNLMDNIFASIASGVITADIEDKIMMANHAAEAILGRTSLEMVGQPFDEILSPLSMLRPHLKEVIKTDQAIIGLETTPILPERGTVDLRFNLSPLKDAHRHTQGVAIVVDDLTEKKHLEAQRSLFERMVSPTIIEQLNPNNLQLGGRRGDITVVFADIRGFTSFSDGMEPERLVSILNQHLAAAAEAILAQEGTIDKFLGDAVMAWFNAPVPQADHTLRAVRAAIGIRQAIQELHTRLPQGDRLSFGVGLHYGPAVLGLVGTERRMEYTAIGDSVNTAKRIQENAAPNQILMSTEVYARVFEEVAARQVDAITAKGKREPVGVYELVDMRH
ncbi:MAG TPA: adenylate/guanylate cyclase domain-containing protein [Anaerolineaceae bacterium]|nr:adenylate/guanylate cyclase domain-containing protein [Anaerolineaceae bacterium]HPN51487.1 adenylate/guanylate cyclase domain-containing protein [Anaerolineaceae bacterium]